MRLLNVHTLRLEKFDPGTVPSYAIASHRWTRGQEASFEDFHRTEVVETSGYRKVAGFAEFIKAHIPHIKWLWIDTCCIDDGRSQEVSEAVNSMFRWYSEAAVCLAYLADVHTLDVEDFIQSEWFTRGWTLQELLAPSTVLFLSSDWRVLGHKGQGAAFSEALLDPGRSLERAVSSITKIPVSILKDYGESRGLTVDEKLAWTLGRKTTREEDTSYCLFGLLDVAIGANYGEGGQKARRRLLKEISESQREISQSPPTTTGASVSMTGTNVRLETERHQDQETQQKAMESLYFPQMEDRRDHIHTAYQGTYQWALLSTATENTRGDNFVSWLRDPQPTSWIYWINAKPGAGKSSLVRFLDTELRVHRDMQPWAKDMSVFCMSYYFWSPGNVLQKSLVGLLRTIIYQLFGESPEVMFSCLPVRKRMESKSANNAFDINWTILELRECLRKFTTATLSSAKLFLLIDGLDEIDGDEDNRDELIEFLKGLSVSTSIKMCVSSRRWTIFEDAFARCPQLRLEDLNSRDIEIYVRGQLLAQAKYNEMLTYDPNVGYLISDVIRKAQGVFLWTRLVVKDLSRGIRDGDNYFALQRKLENMPGDLNAYFARLIDSIEPYHRREACILLQIALYDEREFTTLHPTRLLDMIFIQHADHDFALSDAIDIYIQNFNNGEELLYRLNSTLSRITGLGKGLLECFFHGGSTTDDFVIDGEFDGKDLATQWQSETWEGAARSPRTVTSLPRTLLPVLHKHKYTAMDFQIDFMHRSLRDYLLEPEPLQFLLQHTGGPFDARNYLRNARLAQIFMTTSAGLKSELSLGLASYYISTLSVPDFRGDIRCVQHATTFRLFVDSRLDVDALENAKFWYIYQSIRSWVRESGNFFTLAIDFALTGYLAQNLTADFVRGKSGRPLLDYVLRPRFAHFFPLWDLSIGLQYPDPGLVRAILSLGADPNEPVEGISLWPLFLSFVAEQDALRGAFKVPNESIARARRGYYLSLAAMIEAGANSLVKRQDLSAHFMYGMYATRDKAHSNNFMQRWLGLFPIKREDQTEEDIDVINVFDCLESVFPTGVDRLKNLMRARVESHASSKSIMMHDESA